MQRINVIIVAYYILYTTHIILYYIIFSCDLPHYNNLRLSTGILGYFPYNARLRLVGHALPVWWWWQRTNNTNDQYYGQSKKHLVILSIRSLKVTKVLYARVYIRFLRVMCLHCALVSQLNMIRKLVSANTMTCSRVTISFQATSDVY